MHQSKVFVHFPFSSLVDSPFWKIVRKYSAALPLIIILGLVASILEGAGVGLIVPLLAVMLATPVIRGIPGVLESVSSIALRFDPQTRIVLLSATIVGLIALKGAVQAANGCFVARIDTRISRDIRNALAERLLALDYSFFLREDSSRLQRILTSDSWFVAEAVRWAMAVIPAVIAVLVFGLMLAWLNLELFLIVLVGSVVIQGVLLLFERLQHRQSGRTTESDRVVWVRMMTLVNATRVIKTFSQQATEQTKFAAAVENYRKNISAARCATSFVTPTLDVIVALLFAGVVLAGYAAGNSVPAITAFVVLLTRLQRPAIVIRNSRLSIASVQGPLGEVQWLLRQRPARQPQIASPNDGAPAELYEPIRFECVSYSYPEMTEAIKGASFSIEPGIATALMGKSGSGKTTIVNLLCRLVEPDSGSISLGARPIRSVDLQEWRTRIAVAGQDFPLIAGTILENIAYGKPLASREAIENSAIAAGAAEFIEALPEQYDTLVGRDGLSLSGGQRQRLGLARALLRKPELLILDEATSAVDAHSEVEIFKLLREGRHFRTLVVISHRKSTIAGCDRGIVIEGGTVREAGPLAKLSYFRTMAGISDAA
jgi:subfamily B ATP-binding cassette protein MsbA